MLNNKCARCGRLAPLIDGLEYINNYGAVRFCLKCESSYTDIRESINEINDMFMSNKEVCIDYWERYKIEGDES